MSYSIFNKTMVAMNWPDIERAAGTEVKSRNVIVL
jgi:hypothetical protein